MNLSLTHAFDAVPKHYKHVTKCFQDWNLILFKDNFEQQWKKYPNFIGIFVP